MPSSYRITVATANTQWGRMLKDTASLKSLATTDVLLLQEAINIDEEEIVDKLSRQGLKVVHSAKRFGLAIATKNNTSLVLDPDSLKEFQLQKMGVVERRISQRSSGRSHEYREHGMIAAKFRTKDGHLLTVVNVHPTVPVKTIDRRAQIRRLSQELSHNYYAGRLIVAGDMNHYQGPTAVDRRMYNDANLHPVDLKNEPTWYARGSGQEKYLRIGAFILRRPIEYYNGYHDTILYRDTTLRVLTAKVIDIQSDHRAIVAQFALLTDKTT